MDCKSLSGLFSFSSEKMLKISVFETERIFCDLYCLEPGQQQRPHAHEGSDKIYLVLKGRGKFSVGSEDQVLGEGMILLAPAGVEHAVRNESSEPLALLVLMAPPPKR